MIICLINGSQAPVAELLLLASADVGTTVAALPRLDNRGICLIFTI